MLFLLYGLRSQSVPLVVQIPGSAPFAVFLKQTQRGLSGDFHQDICKSTCNVYVLKVTVHHLISSTPYLSSYCHCFPRYLLPLQPTQTEILRLIMVSTDKMKKAIKWVQRGTLWSFSNILLPLILNTVNTLVTQTTRPQGCNAGRVPSLYTSTQPDHCKQKPKECGSFPSTKSHEQ